MHYLMLTFDEKIKKVEGATSTKKGYRTKEKGISFQFQSPLLCVK